ncbi:Na(+)/H(+) antiporter subunit F [compost metagenome]
MTMNTALYWAASFAMVCFALGMVFATVRLLRGPTAQDRVLALDTLYINGMLMMLVFGIRSGSSLYFDIALLIALFGFVGSTAMARFLLRGEVIEP